MFFYICVVFYWENHLQSIVMYTEYIYIYMPIDVLISRTEKALWENCIPNTIYEYIYSFGPEFRTKTQVHTMKRHHPVLLDSFRMVYGDDVLQCAFAGIVKIPSTFMSLYQVCHVQCYASSYYPESIILDTRNWLIMKRDKLRMNFRQGYITEKETEKQLYEAMLYAERNYNLHIFYEIQAARQFPF